MLDGGGGGGGLGEGGGGEGPGGGGEGGGGGLVLVPKFWSLRVEVAEAEEEEAGAASSAESIDLDLDLFFLPPCCWAASCAANELTVPVWGMTYGVLRREFVFVSGERVERESEFCFAMLLFPRRVLDETLRKKEKSETHADCPTHTGSAPSASSILREVRQYLTAVGRLLSSVAATAVAASVLEKPMQRSARYR